MAELLKNARRIVVKVGSSLVTNEGRGVDAQAIGNWCRQLALLAQQGREMVMVSSGAVAEGTMQTGTFHADTILAKHDERYMPPQLGNLAAEHKAGKTLEK